MRYVASICQNTIPRKLIWAALLKYNTQEHPSSPSTSIAFRSHFCTPIIISSAGGQVFPRRTWLFEHCNIKNDDTENNLLCIYNKGHISKETKQTWDEFGWGPECHKIWQILVRVKRWCVAFISMLFSVNCRIYQKQQKAKYLEVKFSICLEKIPLTRSYDGRKSTA